MTKDKHRVVIAGGGFASVKAALKLAEDSRFDITLVSDDTDMRYYPTLYRSATGGRRSNSSIPLSAIFNGKMVKIIKDEAVTINRQTKTLVLKSGQELQYDDLIIALGVVTNYFNIPGLDKFSFSIKTQDEAARLKRHLHDQLTADHRPDLNYVIVGAGPTGIELAGALPEYLSKLMKSHHIPPRKIHVDLVEAAPKLLPRLPKDASRIIGRQLKKLGLKVSTNSVVQGETVDNLMVNGKPLKSHTVIWTAGVTNHPFFAANGFSLMNHGKVAVDIYLKAEDNIYVLGDNANTPYSGLAQTALRDGTFVAENLIRLLDNHKLKPYKPHKPITVIPAGPHWAAVIFGEVRIYGKLGWAIREAADFIGFHDLEPWDKAMTQWLSAFDTQEDCPICALSSSSKV